MTTSDVQVRDNQAWLAALRAAEPEAIADLRAALLRGLRAALAGRLDGDLDAISEDFAQDAVLKVMSSLESFRGESRFLTWAQKIAIHVALSDLRRKRWRDISLQEFIETPEGEEYTPAILTDPGASPEQEAARRELLRNVERLIFEELTERQRTAMLAILQDGIPLQEVAERMDTNPNALYKLLHDARQRMRQRLEEQAGFSAQEALALFEGG
ncbi:MAG TPA: sigma-70 family RNA polymerase sigma factor [Anaerolineales bacterium]|nr:sigma-70 family RNA polymerase sigma factor [Anaerolineales bacterium]HRQ91714.1 sigma-70 family RNA polymerase sigma factor [Anaerolineales bacterium]